MKTLLKFLAGAAIVLCIAVGGNFAYSYIMGGEVVGDATSTAVTNATGSKKLGDIAGKIASGKDLSDSEIKDALGVSSSTFGEIKAAASKAGIDLNDSEQLKTLAIENADKLEEIESIASDVTSGRMTEETAEAKIAELLSSAVGK